MEGIFNSMATHLLFICSFMSLLTTSSMFVFIFRHMFRFRCLVELQRFFFIVPGPTVTHYGTYSLFLKPYPYGP